MGTSAKTVAGAVLTLMSSCNYIDPVANADSGGTLKVSVACGDNSVKKWHFDIFSYDNDEISHYYSEDDNIVLERQNAGILIYNDNTERTKVNNDYDNWIVYATTDITPEVMPTGKQPLYYMPDMLYSTYMDIDEYNGSSATANLSPRVFKYDIDISVHDGENRVRSCTEAYVEGMAQSVDLITNRKSEETVAMAFATTYSTDRHVTGQFTTFGAKGGKTVTCVLALLLQDGSRTYVTLDISEQIAANLSGGTVKSDVNVEEAMADSTEETVTVEPRDSDNVHIGL